MSVFDHFGVDSVGEVLDPAPQLALGDALRAHQPAEVLYSALYDTRFGIARKDLVEWSRDLAEPDDLSRRLVRLGQAGPRVQGDRVGLAEQPDGIGHGALVQGDGVGRPPASKVIGGALMPAPTLIFHSGSRLVSS